MAGVYWEMLRLSRRLGLRMKLETDAALYDQDFCEWVQCNVDLLRRGCVERADIEHRPISNTLWRSSRAWPTGISARWKTAWWCSSCTFLKWNIQPDGRYSRSGKSTWLSTILEQRRRLAQLLQNSPSLKPFAVSALTEQYPHAVRRASAETAIPIQQFPADCPFSLDQVLDQEYLPE
jgi:hypothetical protein